MLIVNDLVNINRIPEESEISLELLLDFYEQYLSNRIFIFTLKNSEVVKLFFRDPSEIFHISGIDHIYSGIPMDGSKFIEEVRNGNIDLTVVKNTNSAAYKDYVDRIRSMFCIDTIIKNCEYLYFPGGKIPDSTIKITYLLLKGLDGKNIHLGIDTYRKGRPYFSKTLLVTEGNTLEKFVKKANARLRVSKIEIRDKATDALLESIDREQAENYAQQEISRITENWFASDFEQLLLDFFTKSESVTGNVVLQWIDSVSQGISTLSEDISYLIAERESMEEAEWKELLQIALKECLQDKEVAKKTVAPNIDEYISILQNSIRRQHKDVWKKQLNATLESQKHTMRQYINKLDPYWSGKIAGEYIREYENETALNRMEAAIESFVKDNHEKIAIAVLDENIDIICAETVKAV